MAKAWGKTRLSKKGSCSLCIPVTKCVHGLHVDWETGTCVVVEVEADWVVHHLWLDDEQCRILRSDWLRGHLAWRHRRQQLSGWEKAEPLGDWQRRLSRLNNTQTPPVIYNHRRTETAEKCVRTRFWSIWRGMLLLGGSTGGATPHLEVWPFPFVPLPDKCCVQLSMPMRTLFLRGPVT